MIGHILTINSALAVGEYNIDIKVTDNNVYGFSNGP